MSNPKPIVERLRELLARAPALQWWTGDSAHDDDPARVSINSCQWGAFAEVWVQCNEEPVDKGEAAADLIAEGVSALPDLLDRIESLEAGNARMREALVNSRQAVQAFLDMVNVIQRVQALPIPAIMETAQHNCPIILEQIEAALQSTAVVRETDRERISASVPCTEAIKADLGTAIREEENPGLDEYATAFNRGLRKARQVAFRLLDASLVGLDTRPAFMTAGGAIGIEHDGKLICQSAADWHDWATRPHTPTPSPDTPND